MKKIYIALSFILVLTTGKAQNKDTKIADKLFDRYQYVDAVKEYLKLTDKGKADTYVFKQLGDCYYNVFNSIEAEKWYTQAVTKQQDAETYFRYAQMLKANSKYNEAAQQMNKFASLAPNDKRAQSISGDSNYLAKLLGKAKMFDVRSLEFNSKYSDFGAYLKDNVIYFASARNTARKSYEWNDQPFLDIYKTDFKDGKVNSKSVLVEDLNTTYHEGPVTISADGNTMYFSRESFFDKKFVKSQDKKTKIGKMYIFKATKENEKWTNISPVSFNSKEYNTSSPSLSKDGKTLYFTSDMPGTLGKTDVFKVAVNEDGTFGTPQNLGDKVNTEGNELSAFIADNNTLYFASNGKKGLGGLDVFAFDTTKNTEAVNLGKPVNSEKDDFGFTFNQDQKTAFLSSNRDGGQGDDDIYLALPVCNLDLITTVHDKKTGAILANATITVVDQKLNVLGNSISDEMGIVNFHLECDKTYFINVDKNGYIGEVIEVEKSSGGEVAINADLNPKAPIITQTEVILSDINFDFNKSNITQEGAAELDKLVAVMTKYPEMVIFAKSHTDSRGDDKYNMLLSDRRAKSTVQYIISKGIAVNRITGEGFGKSEPKVQCDKCTEAEHQKNRRSEFMIVKK
ncbi:OmpA family protein [Flavobacterium psychrophilum]|uniref:OmpA family protein n=1 Tax=Flavobacterium psychrophilum TaxID=96345 RepID=UPI000B7C4F9D|nr:OmpA family protein [Flavobacterium psychrophilum]SNA83647.1 putative outer membrane protein, OmpA family [Flavobacterium psychrophilum]